MAGEDYERRLAAIMSADVAGYSRLMSVDETGTLSRSCHDAGHAILLGKDQAIIW